MGGRNVRWCRPSHQRRDRKHECDAATDHQLRRAAPGHGAYMAHEGQRIVGRQHPRGWTAQRSIELGNAFLKHRAVLGPAAYSAAVAEASAGIEAGRDQVLKARRLTLLVPTRRIISEGLQLCSFYLLGKAIRLDLV